MVLDMLLNSLIGGRTTKQITEEGKEKGVTQLFLCIYQEEMHDALCDEIIAYTKTSEPVNGGKILYPGENTLATRKHNLAHGIPVVDEIWNKVLQM